MKTVLKRTHAGVEFWEMRGSLFGKPVMPSIFYYIDGVMIDTGHFHARKLVWQIVADLDIETVLLTHYHEDHSGNAAAVRRIKNISVLGHPLTGRQLAHGFKIRPYQHYMWGRAQKVKVDPLPDKIETPRYMLRPIHTPGHSEDHMVFYEASQGWLFSGDLFLAPKIRYFRADECLAQTIESLRKTLSLDFGVLFCAHNPKLQKGRKFLRLKLQFLENIRGRVNHLRARGWSDNAILKYFAKSEVKSVRFMSLGDVSLANMIKSALQAL